ncbi:MAG: CehA/McbA family metallohydrolase [Candidatus Eisenbacteria bacterium]|uniref:CehA/McbA family metallohydrolase n=1 Tax=Eiseniibacteriota bacterium TaxID=2212470 RepID=A0A956NE03_UNCEI|nr:CehA/McbA family metallohydrolase [Candidatus Eisenbacteria bacterium]MCB9462744.1 CehA/McbA family metallohydrolase [Candidatus Eisenbacteria bacterium]
MPTHSRPVLAALGVVCSAACLLAAPSFAGDYNLYWGNFHSHSSLSDGAGPPADAYTYARDVAGIDILALSDHTHMTSASEWSYLGTQADTYTEDGVFVALRSQEFGILNDFGHLNIHDCDVKNPNATTNLPATYNFIIQNNGIGAFNHPNPSYGTWFDNLAFDPAYVDAMYGMEIINGFYSGDYTDTWIMALNNGWKLGAFGNQDNHEANWGNQQNTNDGNRIYLTGVYATELTKAGVHEALRARRFFATEQRPEGDLLTLEFSVAGNPMGSTITTGPVVIFQTKTESLNQTTLCNRIELWKDGVLFDTYVAVGTSLTHQFVDSDLQVGESHYYFIRGRQTDGDLAWSSPIWITVEEEPAGIDPVEPSETRVQLLQNKPNPFSPQTDIRFVLPARSSGESYRVQLVVLDSAGRRVRDLGTRTLNAGEQAWTWDGRTDDGTPAASGVYHYRVSGSGIEDANGRMVLLSNR